MADINVAEDKNVFEDGTEHLPDCHGTMNDVGRLVLVCYCKQLHRSRFRKVIGLKIHQARCCHLRITRGKIEVVCYCPTQIQDMR